jgi:hypothetical protein
MSKAIPVGSDVRVRCVVCDRVLICQHEEDFDSCFCRNEAFLYWRYNGRIEYGSGGSKSALPCKKEDKSKLAEPSVVLVQRAEQVPEKLNVYSSI